MIKKTLNKLVMVLGIFLMFGIIMFPEMRDIIGNHDGYLFETIIWDASDTYDNFRAGGFYRSLRISYPEIYDGLGINETRPGEIENNPERNASGSIIQQCRENKEIRRTIF